MAVSNRSVQKIYQLSVFLENRVGILLKLLKMLEQDQVNACAISIIDTADSAIVRLVVDNVPNAKSALMRHGLTVYETPLVGVEVPVAQGIGMAEVLGVLLRAEINVHYGYALLIRSSGNPVVVFHVDNPDLAARVLVSHDLHLVGQDDVRWEGEGGSLF